MRQKKIFTPLSVLLLALAGICILAIGIRIGRGTGENQNGTSTEGSSSVTSISAGENSTKEDVLPDREDGIKDTVTAENEHNTDDILLPEDTPSDSAEPADIAETLAHLEVHFIDVDQGDAILLVCGGEAMLIDGGNEYKGTTVQLYLKKHNVESLKYLIASHPDADHIGGLDVITTKYDIEALEVWMPNIIRDTQSYVELSDAADYRGYKLALPALGQEYSLGDALVTVVYATDEALDDNDRSLVVKVKHGDNYFLFTGDISTNVEVKLAKEFDLSADVLKVSHHGSQYSTSQEFVELVNPAHAVFSVGDNTYGHPCEEVAKRLSDYGCMLYRTDLQGSVVATSDGKRISFNVEPCEIDSFSESREEILDKIHEEESEISYVLNTNSKRFHLPGCKSVNEMKEKNKRYVNWDREECIANGYKPCGNCHP